MVLFPCPSILLRIARQFKLQSCNRSIIMVNQVIHALSIGLISGFAHGLFNIKPSPVKPIRPYWLHMQHNILVIRVRLALLRIGKRTRHPTANLVHLLAVLIRKRGLILRHCSASSKRTNSNQLGDLFHDRMLASNAFIPDPLEKS